MTSRLNFCFSCFVEGTPSREQLFMLECQQCCSSCSSPFRSLIIESNCLLKVSVHQLLLVLEIDQKGRSGDTIQKLIHHLLLDSRSCQHLLLAAYEQVLHEYDARVNFVDQRVLIILINFSSFGTAAGDEILSVNLLLELRIVLEDLLDLLILCLTPVGIEVHDDFIEVIASLQGLLLFQFENSFLFLFFQGCEFFNSGLYPLFDHLLLLEFQLSGVVLGLDSLLELLELSREV